MASSKTRASCSGGPFAVVNPAFQNWCHDDGKKDRKGLLTSIVDKNYGAKRVLPHENKFSPKEPQKTSHESSGALRTNRTLLWLMVFLCLVSTAALALTILMLFGKIGDRCSCETNPGRHVKKKNQIINLLRNISITFTGLDDYYKDAMHTLATIQFYTFERSSKKESIKYSLLSQ